uniref:Neur_chan_LBD domain-containing protein n=2 Tax=Macrostomum lignano TaxID=282301 RepID=A0A1I8I4W1_9PLAT
MCLWNMIYDGPRAYLLLDKENWNVSVPPHPYKYYDDGKLALRALAYRGMQFMLPHEMVLYCRYNSEPCSFKNFTLYKDEDRFQCISFTPLNHSIVRAGPGNGLYLVLNQITDSFLTDEEQIDYVPGFQVALHERGEPIMSSCFRL